VDTPKRVTAKVTSIYILTRKVVQVDFEYIDPSEISFKPGQFFSLKVSDAKYRSYSIYSNYKNTKGFSIIAEIGHEGLGANYIKSLKIGDTVDLIGPAGRFGLKEPLTENLYFFATGTGVSPFISFFHKLQDDKYTGNIDLYFGVRHEQDLFFEDKLEEFAKSIKNFSYKIFISKPEDPDFTGNTGRITQMTESVDTSNSQYYLCGNPDMITEVGDLLQKRGISKENIVYEAFTYAK
jgi:ferredoxin-NADP reductase